MKVYCMKNSMWCININDVRAKGIQGSSLVKLHKQPKGLAQLEGDAAAGVLGR